MTVTEVSAMMVPTKSESVPSVAELPTCQKTLHACASLINATTLLEAVVSSEPIWNTQTASGSPSASSVSVPVMAAVSAEKYTRAGSVRPPRSALIVSSGACPAALL
ncbi:hypothetical protein GCM10017690_21910 [Microbacterium terregens]